MNYEKAFRYVFEDPEWVGKIVLFIVMSVLGFLIIPVFIFNGYFIKAMKRVSMGEEGLPKWDDWGELVGIGFKLFVIQLILAIPAIVLFAIFGWAAIVSAIVPAGQNYSMMGSSPAFGALGAGFFFALFLVGIYGLAIAVFFPAMAMRFASENYSIGAAFKFGEVFKVMVDNIGEYLSSIAIFVGLFIVAFMIGTATFNIGSLVLAPYVYLVGAHLFGQIMRGKSAAVREGGVAATP